VRHEKNQSACDQKKRRQQVRHEKIQKTKNEMKKKTMCEAVSEESRFTVFMIERRKQIENLDQATQLWKTKNFTAWSKKEYGNKSGIASCQLLCIDRDAQTHTPILIEHLFTMSQ